MVKTTFEMNISDKLNAFIYTMLTVIFLTGLLSLCTCDTRVEVKDSECGKTYTPANGELTLIYKGERIYRCTFYLKTNEIGKKVCVHFEKMDLSSCRTTVELFSYKFSKATRREERKRHEKFTCTSERMTEYCEPLVPELNIDFIHNEPDTMDEVRLRITYEVDNTYLYIIIPCVIGGLLVIAGSVAFAAFRWRKMIRINRRRAPKVGEFTTMY